MLALVSPIILLEFFCLYHAYSNKADQKWYFLILLFPLVGSLVYLYQNFGSRKNLDNLTENIKHVIKDNYKLEQLRKELKHADSVSNRMALADELFNEQKYVEAEEIYRSSLDSVFSNDVALLKKLIASNYHLESWDKVIHFAEKCTNSKLFSQSVERVYYAWAAHWTGKNELAEINFEGVNIRYANYWHRLEYGKYLAANNKREKSLDLLEELLNEIDLMDRDEKRMKKEVTFLINQFYKQLYNQT